jgi:hypothetical protein
MNISDLNMENILSKYKKSLDVIAHHRSHLKDDTYL